MKSYELKKIKEVSEQNKRKVLFINPKRKNVQFSVPHNGLATLAAILKVRGHKVLVVDYTFMHEKKDISFFIKNFNPDIIGISSYTVNQKEVNDMISKVHSMAQDKIMIIGGPYATLYSSVLQKDKRIDYIVTGEAELLIIDLVEKSRKESKAKIIKSREIVDLNDIPFPDFKTFYRWKYIRDYPIMTSRGCPFKCSFCSVHFFSHRLWRSRTPENCIEELENAKKNLSSNIRVVVCDDCPTTNISRFIKFLNLYKKRIKLDLRIVNTRADFINEELLTLLDECNCPEIWLGVEHAHPTVYNLINKGESLEQIEKAAKMIKKHKMALGFSFIIGLPEDNLERTRASIKFAKKLKADACGWNFVVPYENTEVREWFEKNGIVKDIVNYDSRICRNFEYEEPRAESLAFPVREMIKAHYMCLFRTVSYPCDIKNILNSIKVARKYNLYLDFFYWIPRGIIKNIVEKKEQLCKILLFYRREGLINSIRRIFYVLASKK